jgi:predicted nuclease with TOPRIM domain
MELQVQNDSLKHQTELQDSSINSFMASVNEVQELLDSIKTREHLISENTQKMGEMTPSMKARMRSDITAIYALLLKDQARLRAASRKLKSSGIKLDEMQKLVDRLQQEVTAKDADLASLRKQLSSLNIDLAAANQQIDTLNTVVQNQTQTINDQTTALNTAYYVLGTSRQLKDDNILKSGKILADFNRSPFTKVDIQKVSQIEVGSKKARILSNHPSTSYKMVMDGKLVKAIQIIDPKAFWSNTRYLVVEID